METFGDMDDEPVGLTKILENFSIFLERKKLFFQKNRKFWVSFGRAGTHDDNSRKFLDFFWPEKVFLPKNRKFYRSCRWPGRLDILPKISRFFFTKKSFFAKKLIILTKLLTSRQLDDSFRKIFDFFWGKKLSSRKMQNFGKAVDEMFGWTPIPENVSIFLGRNNVFFPKNGKCSRNYRRGGRLDDNSRKFLHFFWDV